MVCFGSRLDNQFLHNDGRESQNGRKRSPLTSIQCSFKISKLSFKVPGYPLEDNYVELVHLWTYSTINFVLIGTLT